MRTLSDTVAVTSREMMLLLVILGVEVSVLVLVLAQLSLLMLSSLQLWSGWLEANVLATARRKTP